MLHAFRLAGPLLALLLPAAAAAQTVYYVDDDGGAGIDYTSLQEAVDAAVPGDRIDVFAGSYGAVTIDRGVHVMGLEPGVRTARLTVRDLPPGQLVVVTDITRVDAQFNPDLHITDCLGTVILDTIDVADSCTIARCDDVRASGLAPLIDAPRVHIDDSFVQLTRCRAEPLGVLGSEVIVSDSVISGVPGVNGFITGIGMCSYVGDGSTALTVQGEANVTLLRTTVRGGPGGLGCWGTMPEGAVGRAMEISGDSSVRAASVTLGPPPFYGTQIDVEAGSSYQIVADLPSVRLEGGNVVGSTARFECTAGAGTSARMYAGRFAVRVPSVSLIPWLHSAERGASLGAMPASGTRSLPFVIPALPRGTLVHGQMTCTRSDGSTELSNSVSLVVR